MTETHFENAPEDNVKLNKHRAAYDRDTIISIFKAAPVVHVAFNSLDGQPQNMPMMGAIEEAEDGDVYVYLHGAAISRFIKTNKEGGTSLAITATVFDGYIFGLTPFSHSAQFRSSVLHGTVHPFLPDTDDTPDKDKIHAMRLLVNSVADGRWEQTRPPSNAELNATGVVRVRVHSASAKLFGGDTGSQIAADLVNEDLTLKIWTGVIPIRTIALEPEEWRMNKVKGDSIPTNIRNFQKDFAARSTAKLPPSTKSA